MINGSPKSGHEFFELNPTLRYVPEFSDLVRKVGEAKAGKLLWAVWMLLHPDSEISDQPESVRREWVADRYLEDAGFDWSLLEAVEGRFPEVAMTAEARAYYDAKSLYDSAVRMAKAMSPKDQLMALGKQAQALAALDKVKEKYMRSKAGADKAAGAVQSGWASTMKRG